MKTEARPFLLLAVVMGALVVLAAAPAAARQSACLDGEWECGGGEAGMPPEAGAGWTAVSVPSAWQWNAEGPHCLWYRTLFFVPVDWVGQHVFVRLDGVKYSQRVFVNGVEGGGHVGGSPDDGAAGRARGPGPAANTGGMAGRCPPGRQME